MQTVKVRVKEGPLEGVIVTVTPAFLEACRNPTWDSGRADRLLSETLAQVAAAYQPEWRDRYHAENPRWLEVEAAVEGAYLLRDMRALVRAVAVWADFARRRFEVWSKGGTTL